MDLTVIAVVGAAFLCGGLIKGVIGLGLPLTAITLMTQIIDLRVALPLILLPVLITNAMQAVRGGRFFELLRDYWVLLLTTCIATFGGVYILYRVDTAYLLAALGGIVTIYALINLLAVKVRIPEKHAGWTSPVAGTIAGVMAGATGVIGIPLLIYLQAMQLPKDVFVQAIGILFVIAGSFLMFALWLEGGVTIENMPVSALAMIPAVIGMYFGEKLRGRISEERFRTGVFIFLMLVGLNLVRKAVF